jgi:hypothetical protein
MKHDEKLKKLDLLAKQIADKNPVLVNEGRRALERIGFSDSKSIFSFIRKIACILGISCFRPATRIPRVAYWYVGEQLKNNEDFRYKFNKTTVSHGQTMFNIDGVVFETNTKSNSRSKKSNVDELIEKLEKLIEIETTSSSNPTEKGYYPSGSMNSYQVTENNTENRHIENHDSIEKDEFSIFNKFDESDELFVTDSNSVNEIESGTSHQEIGSHIDYQNEMNKTVNDIWASHKFVDYDEYNIDIF